MLVQVHYYSKPLEQRRLFTITHISIVIGRGLTLIPGLVPVRDEDFSIGDSILLRRPDGSEIKARIDGLELPHPNPNFEVLVMLEGFSKEDIPVGTEVWSI
jgi:hypothetical protein